MELINQIYFGILSLILFGLYLSTVRVEQFYDFRYFNKYWPYALLARALAFASWALAPYGGKIVLSMANIFFIGSVVLFVLFFRSWHTPISQGVRSVAFALFSIVSISYLVLVTQDDIYLARINLIGTYLFLMSIWEIFEIWRNTLKDKTFLLKLILAFAIIQSLVGCASLIFINSESGITAKTLLQADLRASAVSWITFGTHLLSFVLVNSFLYEKLWSREREVWKNLVSSSKEKEEIRSLLIERESLIASLVKSNKTIATGALSASIAHELNQPLGALLVNIQFLKSLTENGELNAKTRDQLIETLESDTKRAARIIKTLRAIFSGDLSKLEKLYVDNVITNITSLFTSELKRRGIELELKLEPGLEMPILKNEFQQVLLNLMNNSIEALSECSNLHPKISIATYLAENKVVVEVSDNGPGIPLEKQAHLFKLPLNSSKGSNMGLGLWLCSHIIGRHGGKLRFENAQGGGARFFLELPTWEEHILLS